MRGSPACGSGTNRSAVRRGRLQQVDGEALPDRRVHLGRDVPGVGSRQDLVLARDRVKTLAAVLAFRPGVHREVANAQELLNLARNTFIPELLERYPDITAVRAHEELIKLAATAGCMFVFIGFETMDTDTLKTMRKGVNIKLGVDNYRPAVRRFQRHGIAVLGAFILGNDFETPAYFRKFARFLFSSQIDIFQITLLTPLPGTDLMAQLERENRVLYQDFPLDWDRYRFSYIVHQPRGATAQSIYDGNNHIKKKLYAFPFYQLRLLRSLIHLRRVPSFLVVYKLNQAFKKGWRNAHYFRN